MHKYGDCSFCGGQVKSERVELDYRYKGKLHIFQKVPAGVCQQCGEKYLLERPRPVVVQSESFRHAFKDNRSHPAPAFHLELNELGTRPRVSATYSPGPL